MRKKLIEKKKHKYNAIEAVNVQKCNQHIRKTYQTNAIQ